MNVIIRHGIWCRGLWNVGVIDWAQNNWFIACELIRSGAKICYAERECNQQESG